MANVPQYRPRSQAARAPVVAANPLAGEGAGAAFRGLQRLSGVLEQRLDAVAADEGARAGGLAGLDAKFRPSGDNTIRAQAYDRAGLRTAAARLEVDQSAQADAIARANANDPAAMAAGFDQAMAKAREDLGGGLQDLWPQVQIGWERLKRANLADAAHRQEVAMRDADRAAALDQIHARTQRIEQLSFASGKDPVAAAAVQGELSGLQELLLEHGPREAFVFAGRQYAADDGRGGSLQLDDIQNLLERAHDTAMDARVQGKFALIQGSGAQQKFRDGIMADYKAGKLKLPLAQVERLTSGMDSAIAHSRAVEDAAAAGLRAQIHDTIDTLKKGFAPALDLGRLNAAARMAGRPELVKDLGEAEQLYAFQAKARALPPAALDQFLSRERDRLNKAGATPLDVSRFELARNLRDNMVSGLTRDPLAWASQQGGRPLPPLDFKDANTLAASMRARIPFADAIARDYGVAPRIFSADERTALTAHLEALPGRERVMFVGALVQGVDSARQPAVIGELSKESPALAQAAHLIAEGNKATALRIGAGLDQLKIGKRSTKDDGGAQMQKAAQPVLSALPGGMAASRGAILDAAAALYAAGQATKPDTAFDEAAFQRAVEMAAGAQYDGEKKLTGGFDQVHGNTVLVPPGMTGDDVAGLLFRAGDADFAASGLEGQAPVYGDGKPVPAAVLRKAYPVTVGDGLYAFSLTDPSSAAPELVGAKTEKGFYTLDLRALRRRNPQGPGPAGAIEYWRP